MFGHKPHPLWRTLWRLGSPFAYYLARIVAPFDAKFESAVLGRSRERWEHIPKHGIIFHCASVGEFEAARPVIEQVLQKRHNPILTISSPSLYQRRTNTGRLDYPWYWAPLDTPRFVRAFLDAAQPSAIVITKHDIWPELVWQARERGIPTILQSANFRTDSKRNWRIVRSFQRSLLGSLSGIGAISQEDGERFSALIQQRTEIRITGDTRYDRVRTAAKKPDSRDPALIAWMKAKPVIVMGSSWRPDEELLLPVLQRFRQEGIDFRLVVVPHESDEEHCADAEQRMIAAGFSPVRYSTSLSQLSNADSLLVNVQGVLSTLYRGASIASVGGGFGVGVHSVLEPAVFGIPLLYGPNISMSREARLFAERGGGVVLNEQSDWEQTLRTWLLDEDVRRHYGGICLELIEEEAGATKRVTEWVGELCRW